MIDWIENTVIQILTCTDLILNEILNIIESKKKLVKYYSYLYIRPYLDNTIINNSYNFIYIHIYIYIYIYINIYVYIRYQIN